MHTYMHTSICVSEYRWSGGKEKSALDLMLVSNRLNDDFFDVMIDEDKVVGYYCTLGHHGKLLSILYGEKDTALT